MADSINDVHVVSNGETALIQLPINTARKLVAVIGATVAGEFPAGM